MPRIVIATLNARYIHASLGLRYLHANMGALSADTALVEFVINQRPIEIAEQLLAHNPEIVGFGCYIWNIEETSRVVRLLKEVRPALIVIVGGPEVSYETDQLDIARWADHVITGPADVSFARLCAQRLAGESAPHLIAGEQVALDQLALPYALYSDSDLAQRLTYVEASRGCPFKCEFCLSSLDKTALPFELERFLREMDGLYRRGARHFKFVDRTFNLNIRSSLAILEFFLERMSDDLFVHFELIPDHLPDKLKAAIQRFPDGRLQFEIGIQTFNSDVQALISRKQDDAKTAANLIWLRDQSAAHIHADLIAGLPGEDLASFGRGFDRLVALRPHEIQLGILKRLRGTPIIRHTRDYGLVFNPDPPYDILATDRIDFTEMRRINRFARYWDMIANSGRFSLSTKLLLADAPFERFMSFSDWLFGAAAKTHEIALDRLYDFVYRGLTEHLNVPTASAHHTLSQDYRASGARGTPVFMRLPEAPPRQRLAALGRATAVRQARHLN